MNDLAKILGIDEAKVNIKSINDHAISFYIQTDIKPHSCPNCNALTSKVHDYRIQKMKDIPLQGKSCFLFLKKRRYHCSHCGTFMNLIPLLRSIYIGHPDLLDGLLAHFSIP